ncbi:MAG: 50S ribosomal protein L21, partial [Nitrososphaerales archaeon]
MPRSKGFRRGTRALLTSRRRSRGLSRFIREYKVDDKVVIQLDPSQQKGMPHRRFHGRVGKVEKVNVRSLEVSLMIGSKLKKVITRVE